LTALIFFEGDSLIKVPICQLHYAALRVVPYHCPVTRLTTFKIMMYKGWYQVVTAITWDQNSVKVKKATA
jgi:hypothetical protein